MALSFGLLEFFFAGIVFCGVTVAVVRKFGRRAAWLWWGIALFAEIARILIRDGAWLWRPGDSPGLIYMWIMIWWLPTAVAVWASIRASRVDRPGPVRHFATTYGIFVLVSVAGIILSLIPNFA